MRRNTPRRAYDHHARSLQSVVGCITESRLTLIEKRDIQLDKVYAIVLNRGDGVVLSSTFGNVQFDFGQRFRIIRETEIVNGPFRATPLEYWYRFAIADGSELLSFHWTPETTDPAQRTFPHLHVEAGLVGNATPALRSFNKLHIPAGRVSPESVVQFAIEELGAPPVKPGWKSVLQNTPT